MSEPGPMETLQDALERLADAGFRSHLRATDDGFLAEPSQETYEPEDLVVEEIVRFEGTSDPEDEAVLFALCARDGTLRGTFVTSFGTHTDPVAAELTRRLGERRTNP